jgi:hypothetical protein
MITIEEHSNVDLDALAKEHYKLLNPLKKDNKTYMERSMIKRIEKEHDKAVKANEVHKAGFWDYLLANNYQKLQEIITSRPDGLYNLINEINNTFGSIMFSNQSSYNAAELTPFGRLVADTFDYALYRDKDYCADNFEKFVLVFCPYCNMERVYVDRISTLPNGESKVTKFLQLDHFFPQARFPYLSLSFFNLIPSCPHCNAHCKKEKDFKLQTHFNPFHKSFNHYFKFTLPPHIFIVRSLADMQFKIVNIQPHHENAIVDLQLVGRYNHPSVREEIFRGYIAIQNRSRRVRTGIWDRFKRLFYSEDDVLKELLDTHSVPFEEKLINSRSMGKLKRDLYTELGVI